MEIYNVIGVMSGTSMDGIDFVHCTFENKEGKWKYTVNAHETTEYDEKWRMRLSKLRTQSAYNFVRTDRYFGEYIGILINEFIKKKNLKTDLISSHGHTIFHQPENNLTTQIGDGNAISAITGIPVVANFRAIDVILGGQGAPLVGIGDELLFSEYDMCLNLGGFANISAIVGGKRIAYDICPANILLNRIAREFDLEYDEDGKIAEQGKIDYDLLAELNKIEYYKQEYPKSLGREWINQFFWNIVRESKIDKKDKMKTLVDHISGQISDNIEKLCNGNINNTKVLITGGGAHNPVLVDFIKNGSDAQIVIPDPTTIDFKEAIVFALMGVLRIQNKVNVKSSFTGATADSISGSLHGDFSKLI
ncbi:MAG: anhydro-N-acetylmuramic acid kinase [Bacteroidia bacterium]|nr:anhydro-N-acetylmuramic acid kinase [Bacteroidia bacterium]